MIATEAQFAGCLIGQCLGDALGFVMEGQPPSLCRAYARFQIAPDQVPEKGRGPFPFGQYSDDSQMARELLESIVSCSGFEAGDYARRIAALFTEDRIVGRGRATEQAARRLAAGVSWHEAGTRAPSAGNGSAMRAGPVGLMFHDDLEGLLAVARDQGRMTHADSRCVAGSVAIASAVAQALDPAPVEIDPFVDTLANRCAPFDLGFVEELEKLPDWLELPPEEAAPFIASAGLEEGDLDGGWDGVSPFVVPSVLWSLYAFLRSPEDYWDTIATAIEVGGDVDTTAAMAGAISGARNGADALPGPLVERLTDQGTWGLAELRDLAGRAWRLKAGEEA